MRRTLMKLNTTFLISILLLMILAIGAVSASEDISDVAIASEPSDDIISDQIDDNLETDPQEEILEEDGEVKSLTELEETIENAQGDMVLENDYKYSQGEQNHTDIDFENSYDLDGKGHTIDGDGKHITFAIWGNDVTVKNLIFKNLNNHDNGNPFIYVNGIGVRIENCTFENITHVGQYAPIIWVKTGNCIISNCTFKDTKSDVFMKIQNDDELLENVQINSCTFSNHNASYSFMSAGGNGANKIQVNNCSFEGINATNYLLHILGNDSQIKDCTFKDNVGGYYGFITTQEGNNCKIHNCTFENNIACNADNPNQYPIAVFGDTDGSYRDIYVTNTTFKNNSGIPIRWYGETGNVTGCVFIGNNGTINNKGNVYRDNGEYDFEVIVYNDTILGDSPNPYGYVPLDPIGPEKDDLFVEFINNGPKEGNIVISLNGTECYNKPMTERPTSIYLDDLDPVKAGELNVVVKYVFADGEYVLYDDTTSIGYTIEVTNPYVLFNPIPPHGEVSLNITLPKDATGTLIFSDGNQNRTIEYADGKASYTLMASDYGVGVHSFTLILVNDPNYPEQSSRGYEFYIEPKVDMPFVVAEDETTFIFVDFPDDFEGNIELYNMTEDGEKGELFFNESFKGNSKVQFPALTEGNYSFIGEVTGMEEPEEVEIECIKNDAGIDSSIDSSIIIVGDDAVINVDCQLSNCTLFVFVDGYRYVKYEHIKLNDTTFVHRISNLAIGEHVIKLVVERELEDHDYKYIYSNTLLVNVSSPNLEIINSTIDNASGVFQLKLLTTEGLPVYKSIIALDVNGKEYLAATDKSGIANFVLSDLNVGNYTAHVTLKNIRNDFSQDVNLEVVSSAPISKERTETQIVYKNMTTTAVDVDTDGRIGQYFYITLKDKNGNLLKNKPVQIGFNGQVYDRVTDKDGKARLQINLKNAGTYTFAVAYLGDDDYNGSFIVAKIVVKKQKGSLTVPAKSYKASAKTKTLTATFKNAKKHPVKGKKITFTVNGKTYSATTNAKGVATVKVSLSKKGTYKFTAKFAGNNMYAAISKTGKLTIK